VLVQPGEYSENVFIRTSSITLASRFIFDTDQETIGATVIDGHQRESVIRVDVNEACTIRGFTIRNGHSPWGYSGGGISVTRAGDLVLLEDLRINDNVGTVFGGGIYTGADIARMLQAGASGVQMATRFVCTYECEVAAEFKQAYLDSKEEDIVIIKSPVGLPGRAIRNQFLRNLDEDKLDKIKCPWRCLATCDVATARYCIALALVNAYQGNMDKGLVFCGQNAYRINKIVSVKELIAELKAEIEAYPEKA